ncbi:RNA polymerase sigma factor [Lentilactobacillus sp. Marseille-Q4993]|uniref:RNA polymerase sigma factor n=1 Tax=Lentilactobacillus sp. Marseille-Q4993 TaxID=3039492 RepID=UPI0024BBF346|nr:RNA polymerase sigma factor [Lentilactobacillus sp. Marseille-Q4993]
MKLDKYEQSIKNISNEVLHYLVGHGVEIQTAQDLVQDAFVKILESDLILTESELRPLMYTIVKHKYIDQYRREAKFQEIMERFLIPQSQESEINTYEDEIFSYLASSLQQLPDAQRTLLIKKYVNKKTISELSFEYGVSPGVIKMRLMRIKRKVRKGWRRKI